MVDTTDIEKKSLEAHVELCAERYRFLEEKLETVDSTLTAVKSDVSKVKDMVSSITEKRNNQIIGWGIGIIAFLAAMVGYLITHFVFK
jgi:t-SNARE complex subunit (syntaxin)